MELTGFCYQYNENGEIDKVGKKEITNKKDFTGSFSNISDIVLKSEENAAYTIVSFTAEIIDTDGFYSVPDRQKLQATLRPSDDGTYSLISAILADETTLPRIEPIYPFKPEYLLEQETKFTLNVYGNDYKKDEWNIPGAITEYSSAAFASCGGLYTLNFALTKDTVTDVQVLPWVNTTDFNMPNARITLTFSNGKSVTEKADIGYKTGSSTKQNPSDYWDTNLSGAYYVAEAE